MLITNIKAIKCLITHTNDTVSLNSSALKDKSKALK